jgi:hypothetical protein
VVHVILSPQAGVTDIPLLLSSSAPSAPDSSQPEAAGATLGTGNHSQAPAAVVLGAGYDDAMVEEMMAACKSSKQVPWLRPDTTKPAPPLGPAYGKALVERVKVELKRLADEGKLDSGDVVWY